jgi:type I restriction enzyme S subunit
MNLGFSKIGDLFPEIKIGGTPSRGNSSFFGGHHIWVSIRDMDGKKVITTSNEKLTDSGVFSSNCKLVKKGSLLFSFKLTVGRVAFAGEDLYTNEAIAAFDPEDAERAGISLEYLSLVLPSIALKDSTKNSMGAALLNKDRIANLSIPHPSIEDQLHIATKLKTQLVEVETARQALQCQLQEVINLANAYIRECIEQSDPIECSLGDVLDEIKQGIGASWADYPVLGATRDGLAPAKEPPGKQPQRYKPVFSGTVFYNPMRILIGSIAFVDDDDHPGITSPDYVALQGKHGKVDSRWFYYWLRSPYGVQCINSLARGAVRERMLFNRLTEGTILLPSYSEQCHVSKALAQLKSVKTAIQQQLDELNKIPERLLAQAFNQ